MAGAVAGLIGLAGCSGGEQPEDSPSPTHSDEPSATTESPTPPAALGSICDSLLEATAMPYDDELDYIDANEDPAGEFAERCYIEPADWSAAAELGAVGRNDVSLTWILEPENYGYPSYEPDRPVEEYLTHDGAEVYPGAPEGWPESAVEGADEGAYHYDFLFEAQLPTAVVEHKIQFFVPDSDGSELEQYRESAYEIFTAHMGALSADF
ncbi:hypothetical protein [Glycomyces xiaoerkulensis]|uniref:hypothetical protein n=1 Tax=Glycomyces xiaoerkulensis TaxID=2038139 RepID=UPI0013000000|nr:hypothetical protein [Glycomyces xiaoerkulensis]